MINIPPDDEDEKEDHKRLHPQDREENILEISQRLGRSLQDSFSVIFNPDHREHDIHDSYRYLHHSPAKVMYESQGKCVELNKLLLSSLLDYSANKTVLVAKTPDSHFQIRVKVRART